MLPAQGGEVEGNGSGELRRDMERMKKEVDGERAKRIHLEKECAVYQSQLADFHRKLEMEKSDRRVSDARALQLLQEVKEKGKLAQQLREEQARYERTMGLLFAQCSTYLVSHFRTTEVEYGVVLEQLEQERKEASKRSQRLQQKLKDVQKERDTALKKGSEYKSKLAEAKESSRKELAGLQAKLDKVCSSISQSLPCLSADVQVTKESSSKVNELRERFAGSLKKQSQAEADKKRAESYIGNLHVSASVGSL